MTLTQISEEPDQEKRIAKLREEIEKLGGSSMSLEAMPADMEEEFLRHVLEYESAQPISLYTMLENSGVEIPAPGEAGRQRLAQAKGDHRSDGIAWSLSSAHKPPH